MASVDDTVREMIYNYPSLFGNRTQALHHLFIVIGNGYYWEGGELINLFPEYMDKTDEDVQDFLPESLTTIADDMSDSMKEIVRDTIRDQDERNAETLRRRHNADELTLTPGPLSGRVYPPCGNHAYVNDYPDDIKPDWEAARLEILAVAESLWEAGDHIIPPPPPPEKQNPRIAALLHSIFEEIDRQY